MTANYHPEIIEIGEEMKQALHNEINALPDKIGKLNLKEIKERGFAFGKYYCSNSILFIGLNPSFQNGDAFVGDVHYDENCLYSLPINGKLHRHFYRSKELCTLFSNVDFISHLDLFPIRVTDSSVVQKIFKSKEESCQAFVSNQLLRAEDMVAKISPKLIIVENSIARSIIFQKHLFGFYPNMRWDNDLGVDFVIINGHQIPILFTGMLSSISEGTYTTLKWQIGRILDKL